MGFDKLKKAAAKKQATNSKAAAAALKETEAEEAEAQASTAQAGDAEVREVKAERDDSTDAQAMTTTEGWGAMTAATAQSQSALAMMAAGEKEGGDYEEAFPKLILKGGNAGGTMSPSESTPEDIANLLPQGKQPVKGVYLAHRMCAIAWPTNFDEKQEGDRPSISGAVPPSDTELTAQVLKGCENFQFAPRDKKETDWIVANGGPGHLRVQLQILVYMPEFDDCIVIQTAPLLKTVQKMAASLLDNQNSDGTMSPFPAVFQPTSDTWFEDNMYHYFKITPTLNDEGQEAMKSYAAWAKTTQDEDPEMVAKVIAWFKGADFELQPDHLERIKKAASMVNPRRRRAS